MVISMMLIFILFTAILIETSAADEE